MTNLSILSQITNAESRSITAENPTGEKGGGAHATSGFSEIQASELGKGWKVNPAISLEPNSVHNIANVDGMGIIRSIWLTGHISRDLIIRFYWDCSDNPAVEVPLPDFFANGYCDNRDALIGGKFEPLVSAAICVNPYNALNCFWSMPFRKNFKITIENTSDEQYCLFYQINYDLCTVPESCGYFHASFRRTNPIDFKEVHTIIDDIEGEGHFVGTALSVGLNGASGWWGEGEVKFYIDDDDQYPTICGTGLEDYFLGAFNWETDQGYTTYCTPYAGLFRYNAPDGQYNIQPRFSLYRWHIVDPIRFRKKLKVTIQDLGWKHYCTKKYQENDESRRYLPRRDDFASVAYWYQDSPANKLKPLPEKQELQNY